MWTSCTIGMLGHETFIYLSGFGARVFLLLFVFLCKTRSTRRYKVCLASFSVRHTNGAVSRVRAAGTTCVRVFRSRKRREPVTLTYTQSSQPQHYRAPVRQDTSPGGVSDAAPRITLHSHAVRLACTMAHKSHSLKSTLDRPSLTHRRLPRATRADSASSPLSP